MTPAADAAAHAGAAARQPAVGSRPSSTAVISLRGDQKAAQYLRASGIQEDPHGKRPRIGNGVPRGAIKPDAP